MLGTNKGSGALDVQGLSKAGDSVTCAGESTESLAHDKTCTPEVT